MADMTDLEMTRLCAEAMNLPMIQGNSICSADYDPLHNDAQAMALVKKFHIALGWNDPGWGAFRQDIKSWVTNDDLNRAIVECIATRLTIK